MKLSNKCPKCEGTEIVKIPGYTNSGEAHHIIPIVGGLLPRSAYVARFMCCSCGFVEEWVDTEEEIKMIKYRYQREEDITE